MRKKRLEGLVDGIFAIAMTILVLGIDAPTGTMSALAMDAYIRASHLICTATVSVSSF